MSEIMDRARGIGKTGTDVARMYLLLGLLLFSIVASEALEVVVAPPASQEMPPPGLGSSPFAPPPTSAVVTSPPPPAHDGLFRIPPPSPELESPPPADVASPSPAPAAVDASPGDTWNESEKAGVVIASVAALLQVAVVAFLLIKRHQMLSTVKYDDIDDLEYDHPRDSSSRHAESA